MLKTEYKKEPVVIVANINSQCKDCKGKITKGVHRIRPNQSLWSHEECSIIARERIKNNDERNDGMYTQVTF